MPTLKIGCHVTSRTGDAAVLKDYRHGQAQPWLLETSHGLIWAAHHEFDAAHHRATPAAKTGMAFPAFRTVLKGFHALVSPATPAAS